MSRSQGSGKAKGKAASRSAASFGAPSTHGGFSAFGGSSMDRSSLSYLAEPPSFAAVTDPNVVVSLKNLLKKDPTTKSKALDELVAFAQAHPFEQDGGVDEAILAVWVQLYPRASIDNSRRVRELSHIFQLELLKSTRKRMERHIPSVVGAWLSGLYDRDRVVARAANDGLSFFLTTPEKVTAVWKKCQRPILEYAIGAIRETRETLSDERSTTAEDSEAKYFRVVASSLSLVLGLLQKLDDSEIEKSREQYDGYFTEDSVWKSITFNDTTVRKTLCHLLFAALNRNLTYTEDVKVRQAIVTGGLRTNQAGSALEYVRALTKLTQVHPDIWSSGSEKKSPLARLQVFIAKGSQGSPSKYWECLDQLLNAIEPSTWTLDTSSTLLTSLKSGVTNREEPRTNTSSAWKCYLDTTKRLLQSLASEDQLVFGKEHIFPLFEQFLFAVSGRPTGIPLGPNAMSILVNAYTAAADTQPPLSSAFAEEWDRLGALFRANISASLPEVSKEFQTSQDKVAEEGRRWFGLVGLIHSTIQKTDSAPPDHTINPSFSVISQSISLLQSRNLKPFGAARVIEFALSTSPHLFQGDEWRKISDFLQSVAQQDVTKVIESPAAKPLVSCLSLLGTFSQHKDEFSRLWNTWADAILELPATDARDTAIASLISDRTASGLAGSREDLQQVVVSRTLSSVTNGPGAFDLLTVAVTHGALSELSSQSLVGELVGALDGPPQQLDNSLKALEIQIRGRPQLFSSNAESQVALVGRLLSLTELGNESVSSRASTIRSLLDNHSTSTVPVVSILQSSLERADAQSLEIDTILQQIKNSPDAPLEEVFPSTNVWAQSLELFFQQKPDPSLSITSNVGGATSMVSGAPVTPLPRQQRDRKGRSVPVRLALYLSRLLYQRPDFSNLPSRFQVELLFLQCVTIQLVTDQITLMTKNGLWQTLETADTLSEAEELVSTTREFLNTSIVGTSGGFEQTSILAKLMDLMANEAKALTPRGLYSSRALSDLIQATVEAQGLTAPLEEKLLRSEILKSSPETVLVAAATITGLGEASQSSKLVNTLCNRLVSDVAGASPNTEKALNQLVLLTLCGQIYETGELPVANNRIVFAVRQITSWLDSPEDLSAAFSTEVCRALAQLLPCMKDVYGSYWEKAIQFSISLWNKAEHDPLPEALPYIHASLKLFRLLETLPEPNDDLEDALKEVSQTKAKGLIKLLQLDRGHASQPLEIVDAMLSREVDKISTRFVPDLSDIFPLIASDSRDIQAASFNLLHRALPEQQEQQSIDLLLDKKDARLPDELLSLLLDAPTLENYTDEALAGFPSAVRCYLLAWRLVFDAFASSSFKIRNDYTENIKAEGCITPMLNFTFDVLGHSAARAINLDKAGIDAGQIRTYDIKLADAEVEEKSMHILLVHLYYLTLKYMPGLFRNWYMDCRSKQTRIAVEAWTTRYFSPLIVEDVLNEVQAWADGQEPPPADEQELVIKVSRPAREVTAGYEVDESQAAIVIKVPQSYPIDSVTVVGLNRVAVTERKWQSWIMTTQGVITFSNGNIIDGLQVFRRNIVGALKGQGECAICYSIISADKRMPDKRCTTCKNLFHRTCLYKWFQSSNQNTCPLCRNPIDYLGADTAKRRNV